MNRPASQICLGIDIGGTGIKVAKVDTSSGRLIAPPITIPTQPSTPAIIAANVKKVVADLDYSGPIGCGYPGVVINGVATTAVHLSKEWLGQDVATTIGAATGLPVAVINDADAAGLAEMGVGAGKEFGNRGVVLVLTLGTGIGSALFVGGHMVPNTEFGHVFVESVEAEKLAAASRRTAENLSWESWGKRVDRFLAEMEKLLSPELIILGGGVSENFDKFAPFLHRRATVRKASLGNEAGIVGAAMFAAEQFR